MPSAEEIRDAQRTRWARQSASWEKWDSLIMAQLGPVGSAIIDHLDLGADGHRHLDIAAGTGEPGLSVARRIPTGRVTLTDLTAEMLAVATRRARAQGIDNIETKVCSADELPFADNSFDSVSVRFGYMFFPDLAKATAEFARVLRPGGRLCASVWTRPEQNPWTSLVVRAVSTEVPVPPPDPNGPDMFRCAAPGCVSELYRDAGLTEVREWDVDLELRTSSPEEYWQLVSEHVSLAASALREVDAPARERIREQVLVRVGEYVTDGAVRVPGVARCIAGTKPR
jgi:SAM-dependent methyltransferase